jgi:hypothetical protein
VMGGVTVIEGRRPERRATPRLDRVPARDH